MTPWVRTAVTSASPGRGRASGSAVIEALLLAPLKRFQALGDPSGLVSSRRLSSPCGSFQEPPLPHLGRGLLLRVVAAGRTGLAAGCSVLTSAMMSI